MGSIVVGVDGSEGAAQALRWAAAEAACRGWFVQAVLAWGYLDQHHTIVAERFDPAYTARDAERALDSYIKAALGAEGSEGVERHLIADLPARALLESSRGADLLVVGARGLGGFRGLLLGSVSQKCLHQSSVPVAVIRPDGTTTRNGQPQRVLVGVDGSSAARRALAWAIDEARARSAVIEVLHAWQPPFVGGFPLTGETIDFTEFEHCAHELVDHALAAPDIGDLPCSVERTVVCAGAASALLEASERADVVVVGARGIGSVQRMLLGSISSQVALHAARPVVVVPSPPDD
ncbi:MAG: universal stress protein [Actinomycetota bacterium]